MEEHEIYTYVSYLNKYVNVRKYFLVFAFLLRRRHMRVRYRVQPKLFDRRKTLVVIVQNGQTFWRFGTRPRTLLVRAVPADFPARYLVLRLPARPLIVQTFVITDTCGFDPVVIARNTR